MIRSIVLAAATSVAAFGAASAHAGGVSWSVGINVPGVTTVVSNAPGYYVERDRYVAVPVYGGRDGYGERDDYDGRHGYRDDRAYAPAPVYLPAPVYRVPPRVAYYPPPPVVYRVAPVIYPRHHPGWRNGDRRWDSHPGRGYGHGRDHDHDHDRGHGYRHGRD